MTIGIEITEVVEHKYIFSCFLIYLQDLKLIDILYQQDVDLGVGKEVFDPQYREELERERELEFIKNQEWVSLWEMLFLADSWIISTSWCELFSSSLYGRVRKQEGKIVWLSVCMVVVLSSIVLILSINCREHFSHILCVKLSVWLCVCSIMSAFWVHVTWFCDYFPGVDFVWHCLCIYLAVNAVYVYVCVLIR